ncbi:YfzA family protein [Bacillus sp. JCM 19034]|uniref:YfzA family protein n=1 Tax=Bacillus sp. JCM 19034 TaxID=1481928 RepID=UPI0007853336|nr:YfzA family protein [Bacillus sp. JCM 19034]
MSRTEKAPQVIKVRQWVITIGLFVIVQLVFFVVDGTSLEPNINDSNNLFFRVARWLLDSKLFTEWITPYSYPFFNMFTTLHVIAILISALTDFIMKVFPKK